MILGRGHSGESVFTDESRIIQHDKIQIPDKPE
jgi:hypothetical protein